MFLVIPAQICSVLDKEQRLVSAEFRASTAQGPRWFHIPAPCVAAVCMAPANARPGTGRGVPVRSVNAKVKPIPTPAAGSQVLKNRPCRPAGKANPKQKQSPERTVAPKTAPHGPPTSVGSAKKAVQTPPQASPSAQSRQRRARSPVAAGPGSQAPQSQERPRPIPQRSSTGQQALQAVARPSSRRPSLHEPRAPREALREQRPVERRPPPPPEPTASLSAVSASSASLRSSFTEGLSGIQAKVAKASSEPRLPTCLAYLGVPSRTPRTPVRNTKPQGRGPSSPLVAEWEQAIGERAALYPICAMTPQEAQDWGARGQGQSRWHHDSSLISAVVFGNPTCQERRRTRPGSVDPGLNLPGCVSAGRPTSRSSEGRRTPRSPVSPATRFEDDSISIRSATETDRYTPRARKRVPGLSDSSTVVGELLFQNSHVSQEEAEAPEAPFWEGCAGQPSESRDKTSSKQVATLWDLQGYAAPPRAPRPSRSSIRRIIRGGSEGHFRIQEASPLWQGVAEEADRPNSYRSLHDGAAGRRTWRESSHGKRSFGGEEDDICQRHPNSAGQARCRSQQGMRRQFPSARARQASLDDLEPRLSRRGSIQSSQASGDLSGEPEPGLSQAEVRSFRGRTAQVPSRPDLLSPEPEILPSPRPRVAIEEGGGPPWARTTSTMSWMDASHYRRAAETSRARAAGVVSGALQEQPKGRCSEESRRSQAAPRLQGPRGLKRGNPKDFQPCACPMDAPDADALHSARSHNSGYQEERRNSEESTNSQGLRRWGRVPRPPQSSVECEETKRLKLKKQKRELTEATRNLVSESIHNSRFCTHLGEQVVNSLCDRLEFYAFAAGDIIIRQGEQGDHLFITEAGDLEVSIDGKAINSMGPGDAFGCMALLYNVPRSATVTAKEDAGLWLLGGSYFRKLVREHSEKTQKENLRLLEQVHVLDGLSNAQKSHVGSVALLNETFTAGSVVAEFGEECKRLWVVKRGTLSVVDGGERIGKKLSGGDKVREVCAGGCFGEQYLKIDASKRIEVNLVAATDCDVVCVLIDKLASLLGEGDVAQLLERAYVGLTLRKTPWFESLPAQDKSHVLHTQVTIEPCREGQAVSSLQRVGSMAYLVLVVEGTFHDSADARRCLQRGGWAQAEDFDRLQMLCSSKAYESPKASGKNALRPERLVAGETGGRIALVPLEGIARCLSGDMELPEPAELMDYISKVLIISRLPVLKRLANFQVDGSKEPPIVLCFVCCILI
eukprot:s5895_g2.t5